VNILGIFTLLDFFPLLYIVCLICMDDFIMLPSSLLMHHPACFRSYLWLYYHKKCFGLYIYVVWDYWNMCPYILIYLLV
jgi:hypothetical protein